MRPCAQVWAGNANAARALLSYDASLSARNIACGSDWYAPPPRAQPLAATPPPAAALLSTSTDCA
jgi:hypothetical protein